MFPDRVYLITKTHARFPSAKATLLFSAWTPSEVLPGEPVVADAATGLVWQGCAAGQVGDDADCAGVELLLPGGTAEGSAAAFCDALEWGGSSDWRLPNIKELASLTDLRRKGAAAVDETAFPSTPAVWFWSATSYAPFPNHAWFVDAENGHINVADETYGHAVRCVR